MTSALIDLGLGHAMQYWQHHGRYHAGAHVCHPVLPGDIRCIEFWSTPPNTKSEWTGMCVGSVAFDVPENIELPGAHWQVECWDPLTLSPSLLCHCGDHGFIKAGRWVAA